MKKDYTKFVCDECGKETQKEKDYGFPYEEKWCYIYNFTAKFLSLYAPAIEIDVGRVEEKDRHFCSEKCMFTYIRKKIAESKKIEPEPIDLEECKEIYEKTKKPTFQKKRDIIHANFNSKSKILNSRGESKIPTRASTEVG